MYVIATDHFGHTTYFMKHEGPGFSTTTDINKAQTYPNKVKEVLAAYVQFRDASGFECYPVIKK